MTSPFQSIKDMMQQQPANTQAPANDEQPQPSIGDVIAGLFAKRTANSSNSSANFDGRFPGSEDCASHEETRSSGQRHPLTGGTYNATDAVLRMNSNYFIGKSKEETAIFRINGDGSAMVVPNEEFKLEVQNIFVQGPGNAKPVPIEKFWKESPFRTERTLVFKPGGTTEPHEYNLWRGFGIEPRKGWQKQRRFVRHLFRVICRRDKQKFKPASSSY